jgi:hypothetical protein
MRFYIQQRRDPEGETLHSCRLRSSPETESDSPAGEGARMASTMRWELLNLQRLAKIARDKRDAMRHCIDLQRSAAAFENCSYMADTKLVLHVMAKEGFKARCHSYLLEKWPTMTGGVSPQMPERRVQNLVVSTTQGRQAKEEEVLLIVKDKGQDNEDGLILSKKRKNSSIPFVPSKKRQNREGTFFVEQGKEEKVGTLLLPQGRAAPPAS